VSASCCYMSELKHKYFTSISTKYSLYTIKFHYMFRPTWAIFRWTLYKVSQYLQVTTSVYMEARSSKTLKHWNIKNIKLNLKHWKFKRSKSLCDESGVIINISWTHYCLTSIEHTVEIKVKNVLMYCVVLNGHSSIL
jgi:hypothetical protein